MLADWKRQSIILGNRPQEIMGGSSNLYRVEGDLTIIKWGYNHWATKSA